MNRYFTKLHNTHPIATMSTNPDEVYYSTNSAQLTEGDDLEGTDVENVDPRDFGAVITRVSRPGITPRSILFNAATPSINDAATIEQIPGNTAEETKSEGADLINRNGVRTSTSTTQV